MDFLTGLVPAQPESAEKTETRQIRKIVQKESNLAGDSSIGQRSADTIFSSNFNSSADGSGRSNYIVIQNSADGAKTQQYSTRTPFKKNYSSQMISPPAVTTKSKIDDGEPNGPAGGSQLG